MPDPINVSYHTPVHGTMPPEIKRAAPLPDIIVLTTQRYQPHMNSKPKEIP
jgi:hypothetical protein